VTRTIVKAGLVPAICMSFLDRWMRALLVPVQR